jgi:Amt family ammonium transporter
LLGAVMTWFGWFGFNAGCAYAANDIAAVAFTSTHLAPCAAIVVWLTLDALVAQLFAERAHRSGDNASMVASACTAVMVSLVAIAPASGLVHPVSGLTIGAISAAVCFAFHEFFWTKLNLSQSVDEGDAVRDLAVSGVVGTILTGVFADENFNGGLARGAVNGNGVIVGYQIVACIATAAWSFVVSLVLLFAIKHGGSAISRAARKCTESVEEPTAS